MELFKLFGTIAINNSDANAEIKNTTSLAESSGTSMMSTFKKVGGAVIAAFAVDKIVDFGKACVETAAEMNAINSQFTQVFGDLEKDASESLSKIAEDAGIVENRLKGSYTKIAAFAKTTGMETEDALSLADRAMIAVADSAAFYDRSLEETTESLQSFLKGNYENDSALGLSCTETTRNAKANELYGQSFKDLSEQQKQLTLLAMVEDANELSGAMGQAARESDTWANQTGNLKQAWNDLLATLGKPILPKVTEFIGGLADKLSGLTEKVDAFLGAFQDGSIKEKPVFKELGEIYTAIQPALSEISAVWTEMTTLFSETYNESIKPVIDEFIAMIGELWVENEDNIGLIVDFVRVCFEDMATKIRWFKENIIEKILLPVIKKIAEWVSENMDTIKAVFQSVFDIIGGIVQFFTGLMEGDWSKMWEAIKKIQEAGQELLLKLWELLKSSIESNLESMKEVISNIFEKIKSNMEEKVDSAKQKVLDIFGKIKDGIIEKIENAKEAVHDAIEKIKGFFDFEWSLPKLKLPKITIEGEFSLNPPSTPHFGIEWYKKAMDNPMLLTKPTAFGVNANGQVMAGGEAGAEVVSGANTLMKMISEAVASQNSAVVDALYTLRDILLQYLPEMANMQVVMDSGAMVGELAPGMDAALGRLAIRNRRGV